jgi:cytochrome P450
MRQHIRQQEQESVSMSDHAPEDWNPRDPGILADQQRAYDIMRRECPVAHSQAMHWSVFRHADVMEVLNDPDTFINSSRHHAIPNAMNGADHARHRAILARHFTPSEMTAVEPRCREIAQAVLSSLPPERVDAVADVAEPIALRTMCAFLGWPESWWSRVRDWIHGNRDATFRQDRDASHRLAAEYEAMVLDALDDHRRRGITGDVTARLMQTEIDGIPWTDGEIVATLRNWIAGHGTVSAMIGIVLARLATDQELQRRLRNDPGAVAAAIEEIPRVDGPLVANARTTERAVELGGRSIPAGERLSLMWMSANRDPETFDDAGSIRLERDQRANLLYGAGIHYCLGAPLARLEARVTVEAFLARTAAVSLAGDDPLQRETFPGNGFISVPVVIQ